MNKKILTFRFVAVLGTIFLGMLSWGVIGIIFYGDGDTSVSYEKYIPIVADYAQGIGMAQGEFLEWYVHRDYSINVSQMCKDTLVEEAKLLTRKYRSTISHVNSRELRNIPTVFKQRTNTMLDYLGIDCDASTGF